MRVSSCEKCSLTGFGAVDRCIWLKKPEKCIPNHQISIYNIWFYRHFFNVHMKIFHVKNSLWKLFPPKFTYLFVNRETMQIVYYSKHEVPGSNPRNLWVETNVLCQEWNFLCRKWDSEIWLSKMKFCVDIAILRQSQVSLKWKFGLKRRLWE